MVISILPNGPSIVTLAFAGLGHIGPCFGTFGGVTVNVTSGGIDNGARPICDARGCEVEKDRDAIEGTRNAGNETVEQVDNCKACRRQLVRVMESIVGIYCDCVVAGEV